MCCFRDARNFDKFNNIVQVILSTAISFIQTLPKDCQDEQKEKEQKKNTEEDKEEKQEVPELKDKDKRKSSTSDEREKEEVWTLDEKDKLFNLMSKVFLMNFPVYVAYKHTVQSSLEELTPQEVAALNNYCELNVSSTFLIQSQTQIDN